MRPVKGLLLLAAVLLLSTDGVVAPKARSFLIGDAYAADSCTNWMRQNNGCSWRTCVDGKGKQYCLESCKGRVNRVKC